ncbi:ribosome small subunit-dependent GTPase A [Moraxella oblonga]|uniref:ribosome small subunit-dependent GTPase A n=1 Tax=Moraxella oblonga TaxID=200413 RepID=UPI00082E3809|nr:ribosome small subunit-dependent GTPase A [Moraxella oblonga]
MTFIKKRKLTQNQTRQIQKNHQLADNDALITGVIVSHFGKQLDVQISAIPPALTAHLQIGDIRRCHARTTLPPLTVGDTVKIHVDVATATNTIEALAPRTTLITRPDRYHKIKPVASNVAMLVVVFAPLPKPATELIDRYLLICRLSNVEPLLVLNKADLLGDYPDSLNIFQEYQELGKKYHFDIITTCANDDTGLDDLQTRINGKLVIFAGQSGVGKSSLINRLLPHAMQSTNVISDSSNLGQHTTTASRLFPYDDMDMGKGGIIDSPGIREYGIWHLDSVDILAGFDELNELSGQCQFRDCNHQPNAKGCAFWQAVANGEVLARRVSNFNTLVAEAQTNHKLNVKK